MNALALRAAIHRPDSSLEAVVFQRAQAALTGLAIFRQRLATDAAGLERVLEVALVERVEVDVAELVLGADLFAVAE